MKPAQMIDMPPLWLGLFAAGTWVQPRVLPVGGFGGIGGPFGAALILAGLGLMAAAFAQFRRHKTSVVPHQRPRALITTGVYRVSRNPIYLADALILGGLALRWDAVPALLLVPVFMWLIEVRFIRPEEARLRAGFGPAFEAWAARTRRWL